MGRGGLVVACRDRWFRPNLNTMGRGGARPRAQREQREQREREQRERETRNPGQPTPATHPGNKYAVREPPHSDHRYPPLEPITMGGSCAQPCVTHGTELAVALIIDTGHV